MSQVIVIRLSGKSQRSKLEKADYKLLLENSVRLLTGRSSVLAALNELLPGRVIGMKTNCLARRLNSTPVALADALCELLVEGEGKRDENDLIIWERSNRELEQAGYKLNASSFGRRCFGTDSNGVGYSPDFYSFGRVDSLVSRIITEMINNNINLPVLKDHSIAGLSGSLKNMYGAINNPNKYHIPNCFPFAAQVSNLKPIRSKNRLTIIDAIRVQYHAGPGYDSRWLDYYNGLIVAVDPVAADAVALRILEYIRKKNNLSSLAEDKRPVKYLDEAEKIGLGIADMSKINLKVFEMDTEGKTTEAELLP